MHILNRYLAFILFFLSIQLLAAQGILAGYAYEENNRGFLQQVRVTVYEMPANIVRAELLTDTIGHFSVSLAKGDYRILAQKDVFFDRQDTIRMGTEKQYLKMEMRRKPGYLFDISIAEARDNPEMVVDAVQGADIEIYNRTEKKSVLVLKNHQQAFLQHTFPPGSHYTIMIRKQGYLAKRIEVYVNVKGCILCVDGVRELSPGVTENLTAGNTMGTLVANIELVRARIDKRIQVQNIYYDYDKWDIRPDAAEQLDRVVTLMKDNPGLSVELGSHTDSRGNDAYNEALSQRRATAAVAYIISEGVDQQRITAKGYGEKQLVNGCRNGVSCTETEHEQNRRTELRITGMVDDAAEFAGKPSLEQIIQLEEKSKKR